jgi:uncharacterized protein DUF222/HNH endonuclease
MTDTCTAPAIAEATLDERIAAACGQLNACYAQLVGLVGEVIVSEAWRGWGIHSIEQWISWRTGLSHTHAKLLVALAEAADSHPSVLAAFGSGVLSVDQAGLAVKARPEHEGDVAVWATSMTLAQLRLAVRASNASAADREACAAHRIEPLGDGDDETQPSVQPDPEPVSASSAAVREVLSLRQDEDGSWALHGRLDSDHGAVLDGALNEARDRLFRDGDRNVTWADALVDIAERSLDAQPLQRRERFRINLFLDPEHSPTATWTNGVAVPDVLAKLLTCDGVLSPVFVSNGHPVGVGRTQRIVPERTRRIVLHRDKHCRNPLCGATRWLEVHHIRHWVDDDGPTETWNLITLCGRCHRDHHRGLLRISGDADEPDGVEFSDQYDRLLDPATHARPPDGRPPEPRQPYRHPLGERLQRWAIHFNPPRPPSHN